MNSLEENGQEVLRVVYTESKEKKTLKTNLSFNQILQKTRFNDIDLDDIKYAVEYLENLKYLIYKDHPVYNDICITSKGIDYYNENFA